MSQLILHPCDAFWHDDANRLQPLLLKLELIQNKQVGEVFLTGDRFLNLLSFMGCAPNIQIDYDKDQPEHNFCSVKIAQFVDPLLIISKNSRPPKCPNCRKAIVNWQNKQQCPHCLGTITQETLNWKQQAGYAQTMIIIDNIYPQEAHPTPLLLNELKNNSHCNWAYFYNF